MRKEYTFEQMLKMDEQSIYHIATSGGYVYSDREIEMAQAMIAMGED